MILNKLAVEYERLVEQGKLDRPGWIPAKVSFALELNREGEITSVLSLRDEIEVSSPKGKTKKVVVPRMLSVPETPKRASGIAPAFLCDNSSYILGIDTKGKPDRTAKYFEKSKELHTELLRSVNDEAAQRICRFYDTWNPSAAMEYPALKPFLDEILNGGNLIFLVDDCFAQEYPALREAWENRYDDSSENVIERCLDIGKEAPVAILHPNIKGLRGANPTGASLVSFNAPAYESYGKDGLQGQNAPVSKYTAFAYGAALNYLIADKKRIQTVGDTTVVAWADSGSEVYQDVFCESLTDGEVQNTVRKLARGVQIELNGIPLGSNEPFYVLGLSPNVARVAVRFFLQGTFGSFVKNVDAHYQRLEIVGSPNVKGKRSIWGLLQETVNQNASDKSPKPHLVGDMLRAVLTDTRYPETLLNAVEIRIRADRDMNWRRAAIIKAFLMKNKEKTEEELVMDETGKMHSVPGILGQLFSLCEQTQLYAMRGKDYSRQVGRTIVDRFFTSASTTPALVFPTIIDLNKKHLAKIKKDDALKTDAYFLDKRITELLGQLYSEMGDFPTRLDMTQRGQFQLGYYFENQRRFTSAKKQSEPTNEEETVNE